MEKVLFRGKELEILPKYGETILQFNGEQYSGTCSISINNGIQVDEFVSKCGKVFRNDCGWEEVGQESEADLEAWHNCESSEMNI